MSRSAAPHSPRHRAPLTRGRKIRRRLGWAGALSFVAYGSFGLLIQAGVIDLPTPADTRTEATAAASQARQVDALITQYRCDRTALADGQVPGRAVVIRPETPDSGASTADVAVTSFDEGWAIQQGRKPGRLVAVCPS